MRCGQAAEERLVEWLGAPALVLGVGNVMLGDDGAGAAVCAAAGRPEAVDCGDAPERFLGLADNAAVQRVLFVDAVNFGGAPGEIVFCDGGELTERFGTTHTSGLALLARFIKESYGKPTAALGIQPAGTGFGAEMSGPVRAAVGHLGLVIRECLAPKRRPGQEGTEAPAPSEQEAA
jgi:hydrogenase 3 maturation protease